jgi:hypothetical protein
MEKDQFIQRTLEIILTSNIKDIEIDSDEDQVAIKFKTDDGIPLQEKTNTIRSYRSFFGSSLSLYTERDSILDLKISRKDYKVILDSAKKRLELIKKSKLDYIFKDYARDEKLNKII